MSFIGVATMAPVTVAYTDPTTAPTSLANTLTAIGKIDSSQ